MMKLYCPIVLSEIYFIEIKNNISYEKSKAEINATQKAKRLSKTGEAATVSGKKERVPFNNKFISPNRYISDTSANKICNVISMMKFISKCSRLRNNGNFYFLRKGSYQFNLDNSAIKGG